MRGMKFQATDTLAAAGSSTLLAAQTGITHYITKIVLTISVFQATGTIAITDGTTTYFMWLASTANGNNIELTFDKELAFSMGKSKGIVLTVGTASVTCHATVIGFSR